MPTTRYSTTFEINGIKFSYPVNNDPTLMRIDFDGGTRYLSREEFNDVLSWVNIWRLDPRFNI